VQRKRSKAKKHAEHQAARKNEEGRGRGRENDSAWGAIPNPLRAMAGELLKNSRRAKAPQVENQKFVPINQRLYPKS